MATIDRTRSGVRRFMQGVARQLNHATGGALSPNEVTLAGVVLHLPVAAFIWAGWWVPAGIGLAVFGLLDTLDGELARLQKRVSDAGMLLDASADRIKEIMVYIAVVPALADSDGMRAAVTAVAALGGSFMVSYIKAKGESAVMAAHPYISGPELNKLFQAGLARFEIRMLILVLGLVSGQLFLAVTLNAILAWGTALYRLATVSRFLMTKHGQG